MNPNDNKNNKNNKPGGNWRGVASLVGWALLLTIIFSYASSVIGSTGRQASSINVEYGEFQEMVESGQVARVEFDNAEDILLITPEEGYSYTAEDGTVYTKTEDGYTYMDAAGQEQTAHLELFTVRIDLPRIPLRGQQQDIRRLGHAFHRVHAGQHRLTGEVALENLAGRVHKKCGHDVVACLHLLHGIHQQHGVPVGDDGLDLFFGKLHDSGSSLSRKTLRI